LIKTGGFQSFKVNCSAVESWAMLVPDFE